MWDFSDYTQDELQQLLNTERDNMVIWGRLAHNSKGKLAKEANEEHDKAETMCLDILTEMKRRGNNPL